MSSNTSFVSHSELLTALITIQRSMCTPTVVNTSNDMVVIFSVMCSISGVILICLLAMCIWLFTRRTTRADHEVDPEIPQVTPDDSPIIPTQTYEPPKLLNPIPNYTQDEEYEPHKLGMTNDPDASESTLTISSEVSSTIEVSTDTSESTLFTTGVVSSKDVDGVTDLSINLYK